MTPAALPAQLSPPQFALSERAPHQLLGAEVVAVPVLAGDDDPPDPSDTAPSGANPSGANPFGTDPFGTDPSRTGSIDDGPSGAERRAPLLGPGAEALAEALGLDLLGVLESARATGRAGEVTAVPVPLGGPANADLRLVLLVGVGGSTTTDLRRAGAALARAVTGRSSVASSVAAVADDDGLSAFVVGAMLGSFVFHWRSRAAENPPVGRIVLAGLPDPERCREVLERAVTIGGAGWRSRMLATVPSNVKNPAWLAGQAEQVAAETGLSCRVWDESALAKDGFGGLLGVGRASATPPRLVRLDYAPPGANRKTPTVVLVGKGITFDSGGLSIKPAEAMASMKRDMTGAGVVLAAMGALQDLGCAVRVVALLACAENAVSGDALRPGDVIRHYGGRTSEVTNTDAEGRLVMADALAYAVAELAPDALVDVATLTGAAKVALGQQVGALFANDDALAAHLLDSAGAAGEPLWRLPLHPAYEEKLASKVADADNGPRGPGAIMAALFLQHFTGTVPWAHLDVAPVGDIPAERHEWTTGPSGFGVRALLGWLCGPEPLRGVAPR